MRHKNSRLSRLWFAAKVVPLLIGMFWLSVDGMAQNNCNQIQTMARSSPNADQPIVVSMMELRSNAAMYYGKTVTVDGELHRMFTDKVFTIEGGDFGHDFDVLIVSTAPKADVLTPLEGSLEPDKDVRVTGVVAPYDRGGLECAYGPLNVESHEGSSFTKSPVLIIDRGPAAAPAHRGGRHKPSGKPSKSAKSDSVPSESHPQYNK